MAEPDEILTVTFVRDGASGVAIRRYRVDPSAHGREPEVFASASLALARLADEAAAEQETTMCERCGMTVEGVTATPGGEQTATPCGHPL